MSDFINHHEEHEEHEACYCFLHVLHDLHGKKKPVEIPTISKLITQPHRLKNF